MRDLNPYGGRKVTNNAAEALVARRKFSSGNTSVAQTTKPMGLDDNCYRIFEPSGFWFLSLHGNKIVRLSPDDKISVCNGGHKISPTTKQRLLPFASVHTEKGEHYLEGLPWGIPRAWICIDDIDELRQVTDLTKQIDWLRGNGANYAAKPNAETKALAQWLTSSWAKQDQARADILPAYFEEHFTSSLGRTRAA